MTAGVDAHLNARLGQIGHSPSIAIDDDEELLRGEHRSAPVVAHTSGELHDSVLQVCADLARAAVHADGRPETSPAGKSVLCHVVLTILARLGVRPPAPIIAVSEVELHGQFIIQRIRELLQLGNRDRAVRQGTPPGRLIEPDRAMLTEPAELPRPDGARRQQSVDPIPVLIPIPLLLLLGATAGTSSSVRRGTYL